MAVVGLGGEGRGGGEVFYILTVVLYSLAIPPSLPPILSRMYEETLYVYDLLSYLAGKYGIVRVSEEKRREEMK